ncbi:MAG: hypothetical protein ABEJ59_06470 [Halanaeroarchaeum sp.]
MAPSELFVTSADPPRTSMTRGPEPSLAQAVTFAASFEIWTETPSMVFPARVTSVLPTISLSPFTRTLSRTVRFSSLPMWKLQRNRLSATVTAEESPTPSRAWSPNVMFRMVTLCWPETPTAEPAKYGPPPDVS